MISFIEKEEKIKKYITENLPVVANELGLTDSIAFIDDAMDLDTYTKNTQLFFDFEKYIFQSLSTESNSEEISFSVYMTFRNGKVSDLNTKMKKYSACLYEMFERSGENFGGVVDIGFCNNITFYPYAEGNTNIKVFQFEFVLKDETN